MTDNLLTDDDLEFLRRPLHGFLSVAGGAQPPQPRPIWYEATDERTLQFFTEPGTLKVRLLRKDPRASIVVAAPVGEPERWVSVAGPVTIETGDATGLLTRLAGRYWDLNDPAKAAGLDAMLAVEQVRIVIHPEQVRRVAY